MSMQCTRHSLTSGDVKRRYSRFSPGLELLMQGARPVNYQAQGTSLTALGRVFSKQRIDWGA